MQTTSVPAASRWVSVASSSAREFGRLVDPKATSVDVSSFSSSGARRKNSSSFWFAPGHPPSM